MTQPTDNHTLSRSFPRGLGVMAALITLVVDQASKLGLLEAWDLADKGRVAITSFMDFALVWNYGISYGLFQQDSDLGRWVLIGFKVLAVIFLSVWLWRTTTRLQALSLGLIIGGALGNGLDRLLHGAVVDFISLHWHSYYWYIFNIADVAIVAGVIGMLYESLTQPSGLPSSSADERL